MICCVVHLLHAFVAFTTHRGQVLRYTDDTFLDDEVGTIGADFKVKFIKVDKKNVKSMYIVQVWFHHFLYHSDLD